MGWRFGVWTPLWQQSRAAAAQEGGQGLDRQPWTAAAADSGARNGRRQVAVPL